MNAQLEQLAKGDNALLLGELNRKKNKLQEQLSKVQKQIERAQDKTKLPELIEAKKAEKFKWENRRIWETLKIEKDYSTTLCGCGCVIAYAAKKRELGVYGTKKFISAKQNAEFLKAKREKQRLSESLKQNNISEKTLGRSKVARSLGHNDARIPEKTMELKKYEEAEHNANGD